MTSRHITQSTFNVLANGAPGSPPASGLVEYLVERGARRVTTVYHPLTPEQGNRHAITTYEPERCPRVRTIPMPSSPPYTFPMDTLMPVLPPRVDGWFAFNNLLCARGLMERLIRRAAKVIYWPVDFVPDRFGVGNPLTKAYDLVDAHCCRHADLRIEVSRAALSGRDTRHGVAPDVGAPRLVSPVGAWVNRVPVVAEDGWRSRRVVFAGHLVERMGLDTMVNALALLAERDSGIVADIAGCGPIEGRLRSEVARRGLHRCVRFHGFISDHRKLESLVAEAAVALAPYSTRVESFTRYADPAKLKSYLAAGLPVLLTEVPPNACELARDAGAQVLPDDPVAFANAIERLVTDPSDWRRRRAAALAYAKQFDWNVVIAPVLTAAGFET